MACCDICGAVFTLKNNLMRHIVVNHNENEPYPIKTCDQCDYSGTFTNLMYHKKNTHRETNLVCSLCNEEQSSKTNLNRHMKTTHKNLKPHSCTICYKDFGRKDNLKMHMKNVHFKNNKVINNKNKSKPKCDFCKKQFFDISTLGRHCKNCLLYTSPSPRD